jgi:hypothetical protein
VPALNAGGTGYKAFVLNAAGIAGIPKPGVVNLGLCESVYDRGGIDPNIHTTDGQWAFDFVSADVDGTSNDPKLEIVYTGSPSPGTGTVTEARTSRTPVECTAPAVTSLESSHVSTTELCEE